MAENPSWFKRPGIASALIPREGIVHEWITSAAVTRIRISVFIGNTARLSTSRRRNCPGARSSVCSMYESNSKSVKSEYLYDQYHWCPMDFIVMAGLLTSSIK